MKTTAKRTLKLLVLLGLLTGLFLGLTATTYAAGSTITKAKAKEIALNKADVKSSSVKKWTKVKLDNWDDDGDKEWDVEFKTSTYQYEVEVNARTGKVEDYEKKKIKSTAAKTTKLTKAEAKKAALKKAGVADSDVTKWTKAKLDGNEWEIKFQTKTYRYEVEINARTGKVKEYKRKKIASSAPAKSITAAKAEEIAINHAKSTGSVSGAPDYSKVQKDRDDGIVIYEVELRYGRLEFEYEINASTGDIIKGEMDYDD